MPCVHWTVVQRNGREMHTTLVIACLVDHGPIQTGAGLLHATVAVIGEPQWGRSVTASAGADRFCF